MIKLSDLTITIIGAILAIVQVAITLLQTIPAGQPVDWKAIGAAALTALVAYLIKALHIQLPGTTPDTPTKV